MIEQDDAAIIDHSIALLPKLKGTMLKQKHGYKLVSSLPQGTGANS